MGKTVLPPVVYVSCTKLVSEGDPLLVDVRQTADDRTALLVYSALDRLIDCCGVYQPGW
jgi:hypothetical protein